MTEVNEKQETKVKNIVEKTSSREWTTESRSRTTVEKVEEEIEVKMKKACGFVP